jgi:hypothetical protein
MIRGVVRLEEGSMQAGGLPPVPSEAHDPEDRVAALERGLAALVERIEALEDEVLPREPDPEIGLP